MSDAATTLSATARRLNLTGTGSGRDNGLPPLLYMTGESQDWLAGTVLKRIKALPPGVGVIFRHYASTQRERLFRMALVECSRQDRVLLLAGMSPLARHFGSMHVPSYQLRRAPRRHTLRLLTAAIHSLSELRQAEKLGVDAVLLSPAFATRTHPGARPLGPWRFAALARQARVPVYALGGMTAAGAKRLAPAGIAGVAAISALQD